MSEENYLGATDSEYELLSSEEASAKIEAINSDKEHLYHSLPATPGRQKAIDHVAMLYKAKHGELHPKELESDKEGLTAEEYLQAKQAEKFSPAHIKAMEGALDEKAGRDEAAEAKLHEDIKLEVKQINELMPGTDLDIDEILQDSTMAKLEGYRQMRFMAQGDYVSLTPLIIKDVQALGMPAEKVEQCRQFLQTAVPGDPLSDDLTNIIIKHIYKSKKERAESA